MKREGVVSGEEYRQLVERAAYERWRSKELWRRRRNWEGALRRLRLSSVFLYNTLQQVEQMAYQIYEERKAEDALEDWFGAKKDVFESYRIKE